MRYSDCLLSFQVRGAGDTISFWKNGLLCASFKTIIWRITYATVPNNTVLLAYYSPVLVFASRCRPHVRADPRESTEPTTENSKTFRGWWVVGGVDEAPLLLKFSPELESLNFPLPLLPFVEDAIQVLNRRRRHWLCLCCVPQPVLRPWILRCKFCFWPARRCTVPLFSISLKKKRC